MSDVQPSGYTSAPERIRADDGSVLDGPRLDREIAVARERWREQRAAVGARDDPGGRDAALQGHGVQAPKRERVPQVERGMVMGVARGRRDPPRGDGERGGVRRLVRPE